MCRGGTNSNDLKEACPVKRNFLLENVRIGVFAQSLSGCAGCVVYPYPASGNVFGSAQERVRKSEVAPVDAGHFESVLFANELVGSLLPFTGEVAIGEMVAVKALVGSGVGAVEYGEGEAR